MKLAAVDLLRMASALASAAMAAACAGQTVNTLDPARLAAATIVKPDEAKRTKRNQSDSHLGYALLSVADRQGSLVVHPLSPKQGGVVVGLPTSRVAETWASVSFTAAT
jgi:hypothetical protein